MLQRLFIALLFTLSLAACSEPPYTNIDEAELKTLLAQGTPLYDIRRPEEWHQTGVIEGSRRLTFVDNSGRMNPDFIPAFTKALRPDQPVILICRSGNRTSALAQELAGNMGYTKVYNVRNGMNGWIGAGNQVVKY